MRYLFTLLALVFLSSAAHSQEKSLPEQLMTQHQISHQDVQLNCTMLIPGLYAAGKADTLNQLLWYWREKCGDNSLYLAFIFVREIRERRFTERLFPNANMVEKLRNYLPPSKRQYYYFTGDRARDFNTSGDSSYRIFIAGLAQDALRISGLSDVERFLLEFYADPHESKLEQLNSDTFKGTALRRGYDHQDLQPWHQRPPDISLLGGVWVPAGNLAVLGPHPFLGLVVGTTGRKWAFGVSILAKFIASPQPRFVRSDDSLFSSRHFFGLNVTLDAGYALIAKGRHRLEILGGAGFEGMDVLNERAREAKEQDYVRSLMSPDVNAGIRYRFRLSEKYYLGLQSRYHVLGFRNTGGTDLSGHALTLGAVFGFNGAF